MNKLFLGPAEVAAFTSQVGVNKTSMNKLKAFVLAIFAGAFIGFATLGSSTAACGLLANGATFGLGKLVQGFVFSVGLMLVLVAGAELFTGNCLILVGVLDKKVKTASMLANWVLVWLGNLVGALLLTACISKAGLLSGGGNMVGAISLKLACAKCSMSFGAAVCSGILCNVLVCLAVWMSFAAQDVASKLFAAGFPIMLFVISGYEHSIANMTYIPLGLVAKNSEAIVAKALEIGVSQAAIDNLTWGSMFGKNLLPVTIGNIIGGACIVALAYWFVYLSKKKDK